jgi:hypothetical protein
MIDLETQYAWEMIRKRRLADTVREDVAWDILVETGGATHTIKVQCLSGQTANIDWGDGNSTTATATSLTSYAHNYPAGTFTIVITGGVYTFRHGAADTDYKRTTVMRNANTPGLVLMSSAFYGTGSGASFAEDFRIASGVTDLYYAFRAGIDPKPGYTTIPATLQIPAGITTAYQMFSGATSLTHVPLSLWPTGGFTTSGTIDLRSMFPYLTTITGSVAPSQILWDSGKTFLVDRQTFNPSNSTGWLNYAAAYTDPATNITYSKIPYAWGGAAD